MLAAATLTACMPTLYGADFDYPESPAERPGARTLVTDKGWDDDDPMRARVTVIDMGTEPRDGMLDFYRSTYGHEDGWRGQVVDARDGQELCLVRHTDDGYAELLEVFPYAGSRVDRGRGRHLVMLSRLGSLDPGPDARSCGLATAWISTDLL
jgi:hypothetical protein